MNHPFRVKIGAVPDAGAHLEQFETIHEGCGGDVARRAIATTEGSSAYYRLKCEKCGEYIEVSITDFADVVKVAIIQRGQATVDAVSVHGVSAQLVAEPE